MPVEQNLKPKEIAARIRDKVADLNDEFVLAALAEVDVEVEVLRVPDRLEPTATQIKVWLSQEVR